jgi:tetratricopeptide (TPR) repeat protein
MDEFDYRGWERREEEADWDDITSGTDEQRASALLSRAQSIGLYEPPQLERAIGYLGAAAEINRRINRPIALFQCLQMMAEGYTQLKRWDDSLAALDEAIQVAGIDAQDDRMRATAIGWRAWVCWSQHDYRAAAQGYENASEFSRICRPEAAPRDLLYAAKSWSVAGELGQAIAAAHKSLELAREAERLNDAVDGHTILAFLYARKNEKELARKHFNLAKSQAEIADSGQIASEFHQRAKAWLALAEFNYPEADRLFGEAIEASRRQRDFQVTANSIYGRAVCAYQQDDHERAYELLKSIIDSAEQIRMNADYLEIGKLAETICEYSDQNWLEGLDIWRRIRDVMIANDQFNQDVEFAKMRVVVLEAKLCEEPARKIEILNELRAEMGDHFFTQFDAVNALGNALIACQKAEDAVRLADEALSKLELLEDGEGYECNWLDVKARALEVLGDFAGAKAAAEAAFNGYFDQGENFLAKQMRALVLRVSEQAA